MKWEQLSARTRRWLTLSGTGVGVILISWMIASGISEGSGKSKRAKLNEAILTDADTRQTTIDRLAAQLESSRNDNDELGKKLAELADRQKQLPETVANQLQRSLDRQGAAGDRETDGRLNQLETQLERLAKRAEAAEAALKKKNADLTIAAPPPEKTSTTPKSTGDPALKPTAVAARTGIAFPETDKPFAEQKPSEIFREAPAAPVAASQPGSTPESRGEGTANESGQTVAIRFVSKKDTAVEGNADIPASGDNLFKLPATSILTGTLITGLDAPTGAQAQGEPLPVLLRLKKEAILPNKFKADVRECFALLGAYGDLSSERAHMRGETMSCILNDGTILEQPLKAFAVGEDGKEGPRGRLVRREGTFIARALVVGFLEAAANAFDQSNDIALIGGGSDLNVDSAQAAATSLGGSAAGNALGRVADWYIDQAFQLFPVIEIDAGRQIDVVLTSTFEMNLPVEEE